MKSMSILIATTLILSVSVKSACADGGIGGAEKTTVEGMSPQQQNEMNLLMNSINTPIQNPLNPALEVQFKQQQQVQLQNMINQMKAQKAAQDQIRNSDPETAKTLEQNLRRTEIMRLNEQLSKPIVPSSNIDVAQQSSLKSMQKAEMERLRVDTGTVDRSQIRQAPSANAPSTANGMTRQQQAELNQLMASINSPVQNPMNAAAEMQFKQQQQIQLQNLLNQVNAQKSIQEQMQKSDPATANALERKMIQTEMKRLNDSLNQPVYPSSPVAGAQQAAIRAQQKAELDRLQSEMSRSSGQQNANSGMSKAQEMQAASAANASTPVGMTKQQQLEMASLVSSINTPVQNPFNAAMEMQFKQQQQIKLQELNNKISAQKAVQEKIQKADPNTAASLTQSMIQNEIARLKEQVNRPIVPSNPADVAQQQTLKAQQQAEINRLQNDLGDSGEMMQMRMQKYMDTYNKNFSTLSNVLQKSGEARQNITDNLK